MEEMGKPNKEVNFFTVLKNCRKRKALFIKVGIAAIILSCLIIFPVPRSYTSIVKLAPELGSEEEGGLSSLAAQFGFSFGGALTGDAISPTIYPDVISSEKFIKCLAEIPIKTADGKVNCTYYEYLDKHQKVTLYLIPFKALQNLLLSPFKKKQPVKETEKLDIFRLSKKQSDLFAMINNNISCDIDIKTDLITISVNDQDPLVVATIANAVSEELQKFIIEYRTNKAKVDVDHYQELTATAKREYERARQIYGSYADANNDVVLESFKAKTEDLENDMQLKFNAYTAMMTQLQSARARLQERTPAFTIVDSASVPVKPSGPKRMIFILLMFILSMVFSILYVNWDLLKNEVWNK